MLSEFPLLKAALLYSPSCNRAASPFCSQAAACCCFRRKLSKTYLSQHPPAPQVSSLWSSRHLCRSCPRSRRPGSRALVPSGSAPLCEDALSCPCSTGCKERCTDPPLLRLLISFQSSGAPRSAAPLSAAVTPLMISMSKPESMPTS